MGPTSAIRHAHGICPISERAIKRTRVRAPRTPQCSTLAYVYGMCRKNPTRTLSGASSHRPQYRQPTVVEFLASRLMNGRRKWFYPHGQHGREPQEGFASHRCHPSNARLRFLIRKCDGSAHYARPQHRHCHLLFEPRLNGSTGVIEPISDLNRRCPVLTSLCSCRVRVRALQGCGVFRAFTTCFCSFPLPTSTSTRSYLLLLVPNTHLYFYLFLPTSTSTRSDPPLLLLVSYRQHAPTYSYMLHVYMSVVCRTPRQRKGLDRGSTFCIGFDRGFDSGSTICRNGREFYRCMVL